MVKIFKKTIKDRRTKAIKDFKIGSWIYVENPSEKEINEPAAKFSLEEDLLRDAIDPNEVPRVEIESGVTYVFTRIPNKNNNFIGTTPVLVGVGGDFIFTVSIFPLPFLSKLIENKTNFYTTQKVKLFAQIFSEINNDYNRHITDINKKVRGLTTRLEKINNREIIQFVTYESVLNDFLSALTPINALLKNILSSKYLKLYEEDHDLVEDLFLDNGQLIEICKLNLKSIVNIRESYSTIMTNNLNRVIKLLTALTVIFTIPTMIASLYGMNVTLPLADSPLAFIGIVGVTGAISLVVLGVFVYKKWL